jgi:8-oxo-dGTP pyrophosphatase MutT (NUDIX family)
LTAGESTGSELAGDGAGRRGGAQQIPRPAAFTTSEDVPWPSGSVWTMDSLELAVSADVAPVLPLFPNSRLSAVLVVLAPGDDGPEVLLTKRSMTLTTHRGEISFPGGRVDPDESPQEAALREAYEEVGLDPVLPRVIGELTHLNTIVSRSYIVPIVATLEAPLELTAQTGEVDRVLWTPIAALTQPGTYRTEHWGTPPLDRALHFFELDDETVWGATAHVLVELLVPGGGGQRDD